MLYFAGINYITIYLNSTFFINWASIQKNNHGFEHTYY